MAALLEVGQDAVAVVACELDGGFGSQDAGDGIARANKMLLKLLLLANPIKKLRKNSISLSER